MPKVSVLMAVYNEEDHLHEAIDSILCQTFRDFEFIIIDDASKDKTWQILMQYAERDERIVLSRNKKNIGQIPSLNKGLAVTKGEYIARQDADDISLPKRLELQTQFLDNHSDVGALGTAVRVIIEGGKTGREDYFPEEHEQLQAYLLINNQLHHSSMMMRRSILQALGGYDETMPPAEDYDLWWRISCQSRLSTLPEILLIRLEDDRPRLSRVYREKQLNNSYKIALKAVEESLGKNGSLDREAYQKFWWAYLRTLDGRAYQKFWASKYGKGAELNRQDILNLKPFWELLVNHPGGISTWGIRFYNLSYALLERGKTMAGLQLLWIVRQKFKVHIQWLSLLKKGLKPYVINLIKRS